MDSDLGTRLSKKTKKLSLTDQGVKRAMHALGMGMCGYKNAVRILISTYVQMLHHSATRYCSAGNCAICPGKAKVSLFTFVLDNVRAVDWPLEAWISGFQESGAIGEGKQVRVMTSSTRLTLTSA